MSEYRLGEIEMKFAELIWGHEPIPSGELAVLCLKELNWKRTTTYTVLKRLCDKGIFENRKGVVTSLVSRQLFQAKQSEEFVEEAFAGSLPDFVAAFVSQKKLSKEEIEELKRIIEEG
ncbi:MAG: BlaI/MecI/CopY family transcriptional regulator [Lachnospiraceae bacterium]|nr:BlaI/MecI/CopY family transcriptional regulator [Lachnospiraceae bacterium]MCM1215685.1 BlaI/MecI/CopY family transcriptional regulator [Lachnospiraceae bacterium]MCM1238448.1 BlaI/MecI/CopY family transcriptional regulator [Lachnospiraceae bacterium]